MSDADSEPSVQEVRVIALVSVLDLEQNRFSKDHWGPCGSLPRSGKPLTRGASILMLYLSLRCHLIRRSKRPIGRQNSKCCLTVKLFALEFSVLPEDALQGSR